MEGQATGDISFFFFVFFYKSHLIFYLIIESSQPEIWSNHLMESSHHPFSNKLNLVSLMIGCKLTAKNEQFLEKKSLFFNLCNYFCNTRVLLHSPDIPKEWMPNSPTTGISRDVRQADM